MKRLSLFVAALIGFAFSAPAQHASRGHGGPRVRTGVSVSVQRGIERHGDAHRHARQVVRSAPRQHGHWELRTEQVLVPGYWEDRHVPPTYGWIYSGCGHRHWGLIDRGGCRRVWVPERWETRTHRVWVSC